MTLELKCCDVTQHDLKLFHNFLALMSSRSYFDKCSVQCMEDWLAKNDGHKSELYSLLNMNYSHRDEYYKW